VKITMEIPDDLFRRAKAAGAPRGESLKDFITEALWDRVARLAVGRATPVPGWRTVFSGARPEEVEPVDATIAKEFEQVDPREWV